MWVLALSEVWWEPASPGQRPMSPWWTRDRGLRLRQAPGGDHHAPQRGDQSPGGLRSIGPVPFLFRAHNLMRLKTLNRPTATRLFWK